MKNISGKSCRENQNTHFFLSSRTFCFKNRAVYEIVWKNTVEPDRLQMTIWCMHIACWILNTQNMSYFCFSTETVVISVHLNVMLYIQ